MLPYILSIPRLYLTINCHIYPFSRDSNCPYADIFNRPCVAEAVLINQFIHQATDPFPPNLQNIIAPKPLELET